MELPEQCLSDPVLSVRDGTESVVHLPEGHRAAAGQLDEATWLTDDTDDVPKKAARR